MLFPPFLTVLGGSNCESKVFVSAISKFTEGYLLIDGYWCLLKVASKEDYGLRRNYPGLSYDERPSCIFISFLSYEDC
jgi:hypothetical protein